MYQSLSRSSTEKPVKILQFSDLHLLPVAGDKLLGVDTALYFDKVLQQALQEHPQPDLLLLSGDLAQTPVEASYLRISAALELLDIPAVCLPGNHDDFECMQQVFRDKNISCNKQTLLNDWHIVCLNSKKPHSPGGHLSPEELANLECYLQTYPQRHTLIAVHHHCCPSGSRWLDTQQIDNSDALLTLLAHFPQVRAITTGHIHQILHLQIGNLQVYSAPSTCFQFTPGSIDFAMDKTAPGYRWFELYPDGRIDSGISRIPGRLEELHTDLQGY